MPERAMMEGLYCGSSLSQFYFLSQGYFEACGQRLIGMSKECQLWTVLFFLAVKPTYRKIVTWYFVHKQYNV